MKTPTNIGGNNLATFLQTATEIRMADLYTITLPTAPSATRIQSSGGSNILKYVLDLGSGVGGTTYFESVLVKNQGPTAVKVIASAGGILLGTINPGQTLLVSASYFETGNNCGAGVPCDKQIGFYTANSGDTMDVIAFNPVITANGGANLVTGANLIFAGSWFGFGGASITLTQNQPIPPTIYRFTTWDTSLLVLGNTFLTGPPNIERTAIEEKTGMDVATIEVVIKAGLTDLVSGSPILQAIGRGLWDGAAFRIDRLFMDSSGQQIGTVNRFSGVVGPVDELTRSYVKFTANAGTQYLTMQLPPVLMQPNCTHTLFDAGCTLNKASFAEANTVQGGSTVNKIISLSAKPDFYYSNGQILFTSGANNGLLKAVKQYLGQVFFFNSPLPFAPTAGDTFTAYPGDDKTQATCQNKFANLANFGGFPYVPTPETAI